MRKVLYLVFAFALLLGLAASTASAQQPGKIEQVLLDKLERDGKANFFVKMSLQADLNAAFSMKDWSARGKFVFETLQKVASESQKPVIAYAQRHGLDHESFLTTNAVLIRNGTLQVARDLAALPGVELLRLERVFLLPDPRLQAVTGPQPAPQAIFDWGILDTNADQVWSTFGIKGAGIKVANIDTGVQWDHPALVNQYACPGDPTNPACWKDPSNICGGTMCDNYGHGTHTMGTMVGSDDPGLQYTVGMAPESTWIACKGCESYYCSESALNSCADWILAPGGNTDNRPDVVNNSWGGGGGDTWYLAKVNAWRAAGVFPAFSAGNNYSCNSLGSPGDYQESFASASHKSGRAISSFSSKGPSPFGHDPYTKPNISAPGENVCSSVPGNKFECDWSGTSMASPHSAGAVALLWSACPAYKNQIDLTFQALQMFADPPTQSGSCGAPPDGEGNYTFGYGYLNALAVVQSCISGADFGTLEGYVIDENGNPVEGATVLATRTLDSFQIQALTGPDGFYTMQLMSGFYDVTASKAHYGTVTVPDVEILPEQTTTLNFTLLAGSPSLHVDSIAMSFRKSGGKYIAKITIIVKDWDGNLTNGALVTVDLTVPVNRTKSLSGMTDAIGKVGFTGRSTSPGTWEVCVTNIEKAGWVYDPAMNVETCETHVFP